MPLPLQDIASHTIKVTNPAHKNLITQMQSAGNANERDISKRTVVLREKEG